jgi:hypothetical protein
MADFAREADSGDGSELVRSMLGEGGEGRAENEVDRGAAERLAEFKAGGGSTGARGTRPGRLRRRTGATGRPWPARGRGGTGAAHGRGRQARWTGRAGFGRGPRKEGHGPVTRKIAFSFIFSNSNFTKRSQIQKFKVKNGIFKT